jgi:hypothetical protein
VSKERKAADLPFLSSQATVSRNSKFTNLTARDREALGGIEYRALKVLWRIVFGESIFLGDANQQADRYCKATSLGCTCLEPFALWPGSSTPTLSTSIGSRNVAKTRIGGKPRPCPSRGCI